MEDMARLAVVEQSVRDEEKFNKILNQFLRYITHILENPHDYELRILKNDILKDVFKYGTFVDYLKYVGFQSDGSNFVYPKELTLSKLRMAQAAIERKLSFCYGTKQAGLGAKPSLIQVKKVDLQPVNILTTTNPLLLKIQDLFNHVLEYEDEELQALAREQIPLVTLQLMALDRVREQQRKIKTGETKEQDMPFDLALLMELVSWFKYKFFSWVDKPPCDACGGPTDFARNITDVVEGETCRVEVYSCASCGRAGGARFPRHNGCRALLRRRRGRCGEWAHAFALLCRALAYDTRYVYDTTDHVWCEVYDHESQTWLHVDPCEAAIDTPLMYEHGWGKQLSYVIAVSRDDVQDVTWRYSLDHKQTQRRRGAVSEGALAAALAAMRGQRQRPLPPARRLYLARRTLAELVLLMQQRKPTDYESRGRISGSKRWRSARGEAGKVEGRTFEFSAPGPCSVTYAPGADAYRVLQQGRPAEVVRGWEAGVYRADHVFRKVEHDWQKVYLAREEGESSGSVSWRFAAHESLRLRNARLRMRTDTFHGARVDCSVSYDDRPPEPLAFDEGTSEVRLRECGSVTVTATLRGGDGATAWQHAQLCRSDLADEAPALHFQATVIQHS